MEAPRACGQRLRDGRELAVGGDRGRLAEWVGVGGGVVEPGRVEEALRRGEVFCGEREDISTGLREDRRSADRVAAVRRRELELLVQVHL